MKKLTIIGLSVVIVVVCMLMLWQHVKISRDRDDRDFRQSLAGAWSWEFANMRCMNVVAADGSFTCQSTFSHPDRTNTWQQIGTWLVKDGHLVETVKSDTNPIAVTPRTRIGRIIRVNTNEFVVAWESSTNKSIWQRVSP